MKLISMTDFVLNNNSYEKCIRYAKFLKQPLTLGIFIGDKALFEGFNKESWKIIYERDIVVETLDFGQEWCNIELLIEYEPKLTQYAVKQLGIIRD